MTGANYIDTWIWAERVAEKTNRRDGSTGLNPEDWKTRPLFNPHGGWTPFNMCGPLSDYPFNPVGTI